MKKQTRAVKSVGIAAKINSGEALAYALETAQRLERKGLLCCFDDTTTEAFRNTGVVLKNTFKTFPKAKLGSNADLLITFGGDGTLLSVARHAPPGVPIMGVNMGTLGFLTEIRIEEFPTVLDRVLEGQFQSENRTTLDVVLQGGPAKHSYRVINDAVINKSALARIVEMRVSVGGQFVSAFRADGLIVSTPMGSTAYNLSAGGPIIYPTVGAIVLTPICPHMLSNRPIVLPDDLEVEIGIITGNTEIFLTLDGQEGLPVAAGERVTVRKSRETVTFVQSPSKNYYAVLRTKLKWGEEPNEE